MGKQHYIMPLQENKNTLVTGQGLQWAKEAKLKESLGNNIDIVDLPGAYSIRPYTSEESITTDFIKTENPDVIINVVDSTNLNRSLFFTTQLLELNIPVVVALNKVDISKM